MPLLFNLQEDNQRIIMNYHTYYITNPVRTYSDTAFKVGLSLVMPQAKFCMHTCGVHPATALSEGNHFPIGAW